MGRNPRRTAIKRPFLEKSLSSLIRGNFSPPFGPFLALLGPFGPFLAHFRPLFLRRQNFSILAPLLGPKRPYFRPKKAPFGGYPPPLGTPRGGSPPLFLADQRFLPFGIPLAFWPFFGFPRGGPWWSTQIGPKKIRGILVGSFFAHKLLGFLARKSRKTAFFRPRALFGPPGGPPPFWTLFGPFWPLFGGYPPPPL